MDSAATGQSNIEVTTPLWNRLRGFRTTHPTTRILIDGVDWAAIIIAWLYVAVVASDLGHVFPVSPDPTGFVLGIVMIADAILAVNVVWFSHKALGHI